VNEYNDWCLDKYGSIDRPPTHELLWDLLAIYREGKCIGSELSFEWKIFQHSLDLAFGIGSGLAQNTEDVYVALESTRTMLYLCLMLYTAPNYSQVKFALLTDCYENPYNCRALIRLIRTIMLKDDMWKETKNEAVIAVERMQGAFKLRAPIKVTSKRSMEQALIACTNKIREIVAQIEARHRKRIADTRTADADEGTVA
jgi:hypothetical protein